MFEHDKGQKSAISGRRLHWFFGIFSPVNVFVSSPGFLCNLVRKSPRNAVADLRTEKEVTSLPVMVFWYSGPNIPSCPVKKGPKFVTPFWFFFLDSLPKSEARRGVRDKGGP